MTELKPCPFCGGEAVINFNLHIFEGLPETYGVVCRDCNAQSDQFYKTEVEARAAWNRRVEDNKQTPKKPNKVHIYYYYEEGACPSCGVMVDSKSNYCAKCGQKFDWEDKK